MFPIVLSVDPTAFIYYCILRSQLWNYMQSLNVHQNMIVKEGELQFSAVVSSLNIETSFFAPVGTLFAESRTKS